MSLEKLMAKQSALQKQIEDLKERLAKQAEEDLRRKRFLVGEYFLSLHESQGTLDKLAYQMNDFLVKERDRKLFGLMQKVESKLCDSL